MMEGMDWMWTLFATAFSIITSIIIFSYWKSRKSYWEERGVPGPKPLPFIGNIIEQFRKANNILFVERQKKYGRIYGYLEFNQPVLVVGDPDLLKDILIKDFHVFSYREAFLTDPTLCLMLPINRGESWKKIRHLSGLAFTPSKMQQLILPLKKCIERFDSTLLNASESIELRPVCDAHAVNIAASCLYGIDCDAQSNRNNEFIEHARAVTEFNILRVFLVLILPRWFCRWLRIDIIPAETTDYFDNIFRNIAKSNAIAGERKDLLSLWLKSLDQERENSSSSLTMQELVATAIVFIGAGFETTATTLTMAFYTLALEPEIQERLYEEVLAHFEATSNNDESDLSSLKYLNAFINEVLRMYSPVIYFDREVSEDYILGNTGIKLEKGSKVIAPWYAIHHNPELYPEPEKFKPERFLPENQDSIPKYGFIPFGIGPRNCLGMRFALLESRLTLAHIVKNFKIVATEKTVKAPKYRGVFLSLQTDPLFVKFCRRK